MVNTTMLGVEGVLQNETTDTLPAEYPCYNGPIFNMGEAETVGDWAEELDFISFQIVRRVLSLFHLVPFCLGSIFNGAKLERYLG